MEEWGVSIHSFDGLCFIVESKYKTEILKVNIYGLPILRDHISVAEFSRIWDLVGTQTSREIKPSHSGRAVVHRRPHPYLNSGAGSCHERVASLTRPPGPTQKQGWEKAQGGTAFTVGEVPLPHLQCPVSSGDERTYDSAVNNIHSPVAPVNRTSLKDFLRDEYIYDDHREKCKAIWKSECTTENYN